VAVRGVAAIVVVLAACCVAVLPASALAAEPLPSPPPVGLPITTTGGEHGGIQIGQREFGNADTEDLINWVAVNRTTIDVAEDFPLIDQIGNLLVDVGAKNDAWIQILAAPRGLRRATDEDIKDFNSAVKTLGGEPFDPALIKSGQPLSVIGVNGWDPSTAYEAIGGRGASLAPPAPADGSLDGYLQPAPATDALGFVFRDYPSFDTSAKATPTSNTMSVGNQSYTDALPDGIDGFQVVLLDPVSLRPISHTAAPTNFGALAADSGAQFQLGVGLQLAAKAHWLVLMQTIGKPKPTTGDWNEIAKGIDALGGQPAIVNALDGRGPYAFVGGSLIKDSAVESVDDPDSLQTGSISGLLDRRRDSVFRPSLSDPTGRQAGDELVQIAYRPPTRWPVRDTSQRRAAIAYIARELDLHGDDPRSSYTNLLIDFGSDAYAGKLRSMPFPGGTPPFRKDDFDDARNELLSEFNWVTKTRAYFKALRDVLTESVIIDQGELMQVIGRVKVLTRLPDNDKASMNPFEIYGELFTVGGKLGVEGAGPVGGLFKVLGMLTKSKGSSVLADFKATAAELEIELPRLYARSLDAISLLDSIIATDYGKLRAAGTNIADEKPGWVWTTQTAGRTRRALTLAARRVFTKRFMAVTWRTYALPPGWQDPAKCRVLAGQPTTGWMSSIDSFTGEGSGLRRNTTTLAIGTRQEDDQFGKMKAPAELTDGIFAPVSPDNVEHLGLYKPTFISGVLTRQSLASHYCQQLRG
jgi:hypothetical protein